MINGSPCISTVINPNAWLVAVLAIQSHADCVNDRNWNGASHITISTLKLHSYAPPHLNSKACFDPLPSLLDLLANYSLALTCSKFIQCWNLTAVNTFVPMSAGFSSVGIF